MGLVLLGRFLSLPEAHVVMSRLRAERLHPFMYEGEFAWNLWNMQQYLGGIAVWVPEAELADAVAVLEPVEAPKPFGPRPRVLDDLPRFAPQMLFALLGSDLAWGAAVLKSPTARGWRHTAARVMTVMAVLVALYAMSLVLQAWFRQPDVASYY